MQFGVGAGLRQGSALSPLFFIMVMNPGADLGLLAGGVSASRCHMSFYLRTGGGGHMCRSTYIRVNVSRLLILQSLHLH